MDRENERIGLQEIIDKAIDEMAREAGDSFELDHLNLAEFSRRTGLSRSRARTLKAKGFVVTPHGRCGMKAEVTVISGFEGVVNAMLAEGVTNSEVIFDRIAPQGYKGGKTTIKNYVAAHADLVPAKRKLAAAEPQGSRGKRFKTKPGEAYQMDWGFVGVEDWSGATFKIACFAMICHHCGTCYVEFFPNARQENLFIGMVHAFMVMGVPEYVLTDNMKSVVIRRDIEGKPVWQADYAAFMACVGFKTRLCKPRHPFTKGKVERLVRFVKGNFLAGRRFYNATDLNAQALEWCAAQSSRYRKAVDCVPADEHSSKCLPTATALARTQELAMYLCPLRRISFDGFVSFEGRRFGVPYWYPGKTCRVSRDGELLHIYSDDLSRELAVHPVTWSRKDSFCDDQYADIQPVELPTAPVTTVIAQLEPPKGKPGFEKFDFEGRL
ncbi:MAG: IS21 family transposase [Eggerthellaceae bacterium]|nr:IS21 family transposase [Eggerthellaceae bacterium]